MAKFCCSAMQHSVITNQTHASLLYNIQADLLSMNSMIAKLSCKILPCSVRNLAHCFGTWYAFNLSLWVLRFCNAAVSPTLAFVSWPDAFDHVFWPAALLWPTDQDLSTFYADLQLYFYLSLICHWLYNLALSHISNRCSVYRTFRKKVICRFQTQWL